MKNYLLVVICAVLNVCELLACKSEITASNVKYISMIPQYVAPPKISEYKAQIKQEAITCTQLKEMAFYIDTTKRGSLDITGVSSINKGGSHGIDGLVDLLRIFSSESFFDSNLFKENMTLIIFLNRYRSLSSCINDSLLELSQNIPYENIIVIRGLWNPVWMLGGKSVKFDAARDYFRRFLHIHRDDDKGIELLKNIEEENPKYNPEGKISSDNRPALQQNMRSSIPFREIREALLKYVYKQEIVTNLIRNPDTLFIYMAIHDSDIVHLNHLYDHYFEILNANEFPVLASTGYQTARENHPHYEIISRIEEAIRGLSGREKSEKIKELCESDPKVATALNVQGRAYVKGYEDYCKENNFVSYDDLNSNIDLDMQTRQALSLSDPRLLYWPEPNMIFKVFDKKCGIDYKKYSFTEEGIYTDPYESSVLLHSIYIQNEGKVTAVFSPSHPVELKLNRSFMLSKTFSSLPQAHYIFRNTAIVVYRQLSIKGSRSEFVSTFSNLYSLFSKASSLGVSKDDVESVCISPFCSGINKKFNISPPIDFEKSVLEIGKIPYKASVVIEGLKNRTRVKQ